MPLQKFPTIKIRGVIAGQVDFDPPTDQAGNRNFRFTPAGATQPQPPQSVLVTRLGNVRTITSNPPFTLMANGVIYDSLSGSINIPAKSASGQLHVQGTPPAGPEDQVNWSSDDVVTPIAEEEEAVSAASAGGQAPAYK
ncbi:MAG: hypothetical protein K2X03_12025 [Bryobacteraceae bacterium]|nr:hypothetical protein [Bryobacteraceae bacterium]